MPTLGEIIMVFHGQRASFCVVPDYINVQFDRVLSSPFFINGKCEIKYNTKELVIQGRSIPFSMDGEQLIRQQHSAEFEHRECYTVNSKNNTESKGDCTNKIVNESPISDAATDILTKFLNAYND